MSTTQDESLVKLVRERIEPGASVLLSGPVHSGQLGLCFDLLTPESNGDTGSLFISTDLRSKNILDEFQRRNGDVERSRYCIVDARGDQSPGAEASDDVVSFVSSPGDLTGIGIEVVRGLDILQRRGVDDVVLGVHSISTLTQYLDAATVFKFLHTLVGRCAATGVTSVGTLNAPIHDDQVVNLIASVYDVHVQIREMEHGDGFEARVLGSTTGPTAWLPLG